MPFVPFVDTAMVEIVQLCQGQKVENTLYFQDTASSLDDAKMTALGNAILEWWDDNLADLTTTASHIIEVKVTDLTLVDANSITIVPTGGAGAGGNTGPPMPNGSTLCVSFRTAFRGRSNRGRNYVVGMTKDHTIGNVVTGFYGNAVQTAYQALLPVAADLALTWMVASRWENKVLRTAGSVAPVIAALITDLNVDSQRRRLVGRGE